MVVQYPYTLEVLNLIDGGQDAEGNILKPTEEWVKVCNCRDEAGNGKKITLTDNSIHEFAFLVQMPKGTTAIEPGRTIRVLDGLNVRCTGKVVYSRKDQLHSRLWV